MFWQFYRDRIWKPVLCALMAASVSLCMFQGFNLDRHSISDNFPVTFLLSLLLELILTVFSYNRRSILTGVFTAVAAAVIFFLSIKMRGITIEDKLSSPGVIYIYVIILFTVSVVLFLLGSSRIGTMILFVCGIYVIAGLKYLEFDSSLLYLIVFSAAALIEFAFLEYNRSSMDSLVYRPDFTRFGLSTSALAGAALGIAALMFFAVVVPMNPDAKDLTLLTKHIAIENLKVTGIMDQYPVEDPNLKTDQSNQEQQQAQEDENTETQAESGSNGAGTEQSSESQQNNGGAGNQGSGKKEKGRAITYEHHINKKVLFLLLIVLAAAAAVGLKLLHRKYWLRKVREKDPNEQIECLYLGLLKKFHRLGFGRRPEDTPMNYAGKNRRQLKYFLSESADFTVLTGIFLRIRYGQFQAGQQDCELFYQVYENFYRNSRAYLGNMKYIRRFFWL